VSDQGEGGSGSGTSMASVTGDGNREGKAMGYDRFHRGREGGGEAAPRCQRRTAQQRAVGEVEGGDLHLEVKDDQRKLGRWAKCAVGLNY
jgi:hypothetical protein